MSKRSKIQDLNPFYWTTLIKEDNIVFHLLFSACCKCAGYHDRTQTESHSPHTEQQVCVLEALGRYESYLNNKNHSFVKEYKITNLIPRRNARNSLSSVGRSEGSIRMEISLITSTSSDIAHMSIYFIFFESDIKKCFFVC